MLIMKENCENCQKVLKQDSTEAMICGGFEPRPTRISK